ncbi:MAG TPA: FAD-dependent monooxygenase, partial [Acidimicrobiia bacterium]|nr:FAD-dependent monooxygenase [Acidimicrobiia bacterium]
MRTQVAIVGAGPAGLVLAHLLHRAGIDSVVLEARSRRYVEQRVRAGVLEHPTVQLLCDTGVGDRLRREGLRHRGISLRFDRSDHHLDFVALAGRSITVYGQQEIVKDLIAARLDAGAPILFDVGNVRLSGLDSDEPEVAFTDGDGVERVLRAALVAGCDGFHGVCRPSIPAGQLRTFERDYPYAWLGILAKAAPVQPEVTYAYSDRGFALASMRSPDVTRLYLQVTPDENLDAWPDERIWEELN